MLIGLNLSFNFSHLQESLKSSRNFQHWCSKSYYTSSKKYIIVRSYTYVYKRSAFPQLNIKLHQQSSSTSVIITLKKNPTEFLFNVKRTNIQNILLSGRFFNAKLAQKYSQQNCNFLYAKTS